MRIRFGVLVLRHRQLACIALKFDQRPRHFERRLVYGRHNGKGRDASKA
jgi:hypothetical protein